MLTVQTLPGLTMQALQTSVIIVAYLGLCSALRYRRIKAMQKKYKYGSIEHPSFAGMTDQEAFEIMNILNQLEFPAIYEKGLQFALFRTYAIPTISSLLVKTAQLSETKNVGKRYADTTALIVEIYGNKPDSERGREAFGRLNYLHGHYIRQGKISNDDLLYTLALFMNQPVEWINRYEWRQMTNLEICALGVFHKSMGDAMEIKFDSLPSSTSGWSDGLQFYRELDQWALKYEEKNMVPHEKNHQTALKTKQLLMSTAPRFAHQFLSHVVDAAMDDRLRVAMMFDKPPAIYLKMLNWLMDSRRFFLRHLALPRPYVLRYEIVSNEANPDGRRNFTQYATEPHYVKPTTWNRWGPGAWVARLIGNPLPGDPRMYPEGFLTKEIGPDVFVGKGHQQTKETKQKLEVQRTGGCPFSIK